MTIDPEMTAAEIAAAIATKKLTAFEVTEAALARITRYNGLLGAFTDFTFRRARAKALAIDADIADGKQVGPLAGVPFAVRICSTLLG